MVLVLCMLMRPKKKVLDFAHILWSLNQRLYLSGAFARAYLDDFFSVSPRLFLLECAFKREQVFFCSCGRCWEKCPRTHLLTPTPTRLSGGPSVLSFSMLSVALFSVFVSMSLNVCLYELSCSMFSPSLTLLLLHAGSEIEWWARVGGDITSPSYGEKYESTSLGSARLF